MRTAHSAKGAASAATAASCQGSERKLVRTLYKALVCSARSFEREPALNAFLYRRRIAPGVATTPPASSSSDDDEPVGGGTGDSSAAAPPATLMDEIYDEFLGSRQARFFHPDLSHRTVLDVEREMRLDLGFQVMKELEEAIAMGKQIGIVKGPTAPEAASSTESSTTSIASAEAALPPSTLAQATTSGDGVSSASPPRPHYARAASVSDVRPGMLLVPHPLLLDPFWQHTVIMLLNYTPLTGATGAVINRPESRLFTRNKRPLDDKEPEKKYFKAFYGGPVGLPELYWLSKAEPTVLPPAEEVYPGLYHGRSMAVFDWNREAQKSDGKEKDEMKDIGASNVGEDESSGRAGKNEQEEDVKEGDSAAKMKAEPNVQETNIWSDPDTKLFFGRAAWVPGQLESELQEGTWFVARPEGTSAVFPDQPLFSATSLPPGRVVDPADRDKQSRFWADLLHDMGGRYAPLAKFALPTLPRGEHNDDDDDADDDDHEDGSDSDDGEER